MATFQDIRGQIELKVRDAYAPTPVCFDNVDESPPADVPYVICIISWPSTTEPVICQGESMVENIRGNLQISCYAPRGKGMKPLEEMGATAMTVMNTLYDWSSTTRIKCSQVEGPTPVLAGDGPLALITTSCAFVAKAA